MIAIESFTENAGQPERNAIEKALNLKPWVRKLAQVNGTAYYLVRRRDHSSEHVIRLRQDRDKQLFAGCDCRAGSPPEDAKTKLPTHQPQPCFHVAALLLKLSAKSNESGRKLQWK